MALVYKYVLVCDEIRRESNGKLILLGLYTPNISVPEIPTHIRGLAFLFGLEADGPGDHKFSVKLAHLESGTDLLTATGGLTVAAAGFATLPIQLPAMLNVEKAGAYSVSIEIDGNEPNVYTFSIMPASTKSKSASS